MRSIRTTQDEECVWVVFESILNLAHRTSRPGRSAPSAEVDCFYGDAALLAGSGEHSPQDQGLVLGDVANAALLQDMYKAANEAHVWLCRCVHRHASPANTNPNRGTSTGIACPGAGQNLSLFRRRGVE